MNEKTCMPVDRVSDDEEIGLSRKKKRQSRYTEEEYHIEDPCAVALSVPIKVEKKPLSATKYISDTTRRSTPQQKTPAK